MGANAESIDKILERRHVSAVIRWNNTEELYFRHHCGPCLRLARVRTQEKLPYHRKCCWPCEPYRERLDCATWLPTAGDCAPGTGHLLAKPPDDNLCGGGSNDSYRGHCGRLF
ncbi:hypothetical protein ISCGN_006619 [Ixodes scapularis]